MLDDTEVVAIIGPAVPRRAEETKPTSAVAKSVTEKPLTG